MKFKLLLKHKLIYSEALNIVFAYRLIYRDDKCTAKQGSGMAVRLRDEDDVHGFLGPPCSACKLIVLLLHHMLQKLGLLLQITITSLSVHSKIHFNLVTEFQR